MMEVTECVGERRLARRNETCEEKYYEIYNIMDRGNKRFCTFPCPPTIMTFRVICLSCDRYLCMSEQGPNVGKRSRCIIHYHN